MTGEMTQYFRTRDGDMWEDGRWFDMGEQDLSDLLEICEDQIDMSDPKNRGDCTDNYEDIADENRRRTEVIAQTILRILGALDNVIAANALADEMTTENEDLSDDNDVHEETLTVVQFYMRVDEMEAMMAEVTK